MNPLTNRYERDKLIGFFIINYGLPRVLTHYERITAAISLRQAKQNYKFWQEIGGII